MLFINTYKPKAGFTHEDQKKMLQLWESWTAPEGFEIKSFHVAPDGRGFILFEASSPEVIYEGSSLWSNVLIDYEFTPVMEIDKAVELLNKAIATRESL